MLPVSVFSVHAYCSFIKVFSYRLLQRGLKSQARPFQIKIKQDTCFAAKKKKNYSQTEVHAVYNTKRIQPFFVSLTVLQANKTAESPLPQLQTAAESQVRKTILHTAILSPAWLHLYRCHWHGPDTEAWICYWMVKWHENYGFIYVQVWDFHCNKPACTQPNSVVWHHNYIFIAVFFFKGKGNICRKWVIKMKNSNHVDTGYYWALSSKVFVLSKWKKTSQK